MNNNSIPGWDFERDTFVTNEKRPIRQDQELVELLWQNGQVVMQSQSHKNLRQVQKTDQSTTLRTSGPPYGNTSNLTQEDEKATWIQNQQYPFEELLEQEFYSNLLSELAPHHATSSSQELPNMKPSCVEEFQGNHPIPAPPRFNELNHSSKKSNDFCGSQKVQNFPHFSAPQFGEKVTSNVSQSEVRECSVMTVGSSHCGSNHILNKDCVQRTIPLSDKKGKTEMVEPSITSSSGGSGSSIGRTCSLISTRNQGQKRKGIDAEASEELSEFTEQKSGDGNKASKRIGSSRRNRVAEVHNLSERRRRDRINEKMRALQQLIPNSNKTDKASMLEEAIEYLKSLQLQLQVMWMGAGMTPMMFPGIQQFMSQMSMGMVSPSLPSINNPMQIPRVSPDQSTQVPQMPNQTMMCQNPVLSAFNYQNQMQNPCFPEQFARYMGYHLMQSASQPMNVFRYGSQPHAVQHSHTMNVAPSNRSGPITQADNIDHSLSGKSGMLNNTSTLYFPSQQNKDNN